MISNDERHEVARQLRNEFANDFDGANPRYVRLYDQGIGYISLNRYAAMRLADLLDGSMCKMVYNSHNDDYLCTNCGELFEVIGYNVPRSRVINGFVYCPHCGAKVVDDE